MGSAVEYQRCFCMLISDALSNHWQLGESQSSPSSQGLRIRMARVPSKSPNVVSNVAVNGLSGGVTSPMLPPGPMAPLPPKVAKEPLGRCMPEAQKTLVVTPMGVDLRVAMS